jgi:hypothetical protein
LLTNDFKNLKLLAYLSLDFGPNISLKAIISTTFFVKMSL